MLCPVMPYQAMQRLCPSLASASLCFCAQLANTEITEMLTEPTTTTTAALCTVPLQDYDSLHLRENRPCAMHLHGRSELLSRFQVSATGNPSSSLLLSRLDSVEVETLHRSFPTSCFFESLRRIVQELFAASEGEHQTCPQPAPPHLKPILPMITRTTLQLKRTTPRSKHGT